MIKITKLLYTLSIFIFLAMLLYVYAFLPEQFGIFFDGSGKASIMIGRTDFFYAALGLFVLTNGAILLYRRMNRGSLNLSKTSFDEMSAPEIVYHWLNGLSFVINVIYIFSIMFVGMYHNSEHFDIANYAALIYIGPVLLAGWIFWFIYLQISKR
ncbi:hypothetical protein N7E81_14585 [Reichenbachiella carrageenanivorans]|uniref:DUF1648 domain-containing protein n=1 Tax=Reichenbachiella carrageenanivorans TaxID=2979869 RepID=A0ABY6CYY3_9BACT|nr:hypothetical protein [Reichenbachiella carrageenanivorans]UXX78585.1 hypothetical protein N7E81_14585 [Reichenbachiella carrageenanivorans]